MLVETKSPSMPPPSTFSFEKFQAECVEGGGKGGGYKIVQSIKFGGLSENERTHLKAR